MIPRSLTRGAALRPETRGWVLAVLLVFGALVCFALFLAPLPGSQPSALVPVLGGVLLALAVPVALSGRRTGLLWWLLAATCVVIGVVVAQATSTTGLVVASTGYIYASLYGAWAFDQRRHLALLGVVTVSSLVGSAASEPGLTLAVWGASVGGVVVASAVLGHVMGLLRWYATVDALTGVLTRPAFEAIARSTLAGARRRGTEAVLVLIDLDDFKVVNDTLGHAAGDAVLTRTVTAWQGRLRAQDVLGRAGGDEFVLLLPDTGLDGAERVVAALADVSPVGFSAGLAPATDEDSLSQLLARADDHMYLAKRERTEPAPPVADPMSTTAGE